MPDALVTASSVHSQEYEPQYAADGDGQTRWASNPGYGEDWLQLDLGRVVPIGGIRITWERAHAREYEIRVSTDGTAWETVHREANGAEASPNRRHYRVGAPTCALPA